MRSALLQGLQTNQGRKFIGASFTSRRRSWMVLNTRLVAGMLADEHGRSAPPWQCPSSAPAAPQRAPAGSGQLGTPRARPGHWAPSHGLGGSSEPPPKPFTVLGVHCPWTTQARRRGRLHRRPAAPRQPAAAPPALPRPLPAGARSPAALQPCSPAALQPCSPAAMQPRAPQPATPRAPACSPV